MSKRALFFIQKILIVIGAVIAITGLSVDWLGAGTEGFGFGATQMAMVILGLSIVAWIPILRIKRLFQRSIYAVILAIFLFLLWCFKLYPTSWGNMNPFLSTSLTFRILVISHLSVLFLALLAAGVALWGVLVIVKKPMWGNIVIFSLSLIVTLLFAEILFRIILFSNLSGFEHLRNPELYADWFSDDDYWKLYYLFDGPIKPPEHPHLLLGWIGDFSRDTYIHNQVDQLRGRRPVLLYGDSFAQCIWNVECFEDILNNDKEFSKHHYLLNYGVGGYGVDQIFLLLQNSIHLYEDPFVIVSLMTLDLDRGILSIRLGQKPYFQIENGELKLCGTPIQQDPKQFFSDNPPRITSYVYRKILHGTYLPKFLISHLRRENESIRKKQEINKKIILEIIKELKIKGNDFIFLIFHPHWPGISRLDSESDWRDQFLKELLHENDIPYIWSKEIFRKNIEVRGGVYTFDDYILPSDGHPTSYFNTLIAEEIKKAVLGGQENDS